MKILPTNNFNTCQLNFKAKINLNSTGVREYTEYLSQCIDAPKGYFRSNKNIELFNKICEAFEKHPSSEIIETSVFYRYGELFNARGVVKTSKAKITDVEPSRSDDGTGPMENLFRKLLNPANKMVFNKLLGKEHSGVYRSWWNENIQPIWDDINITYIFEPLEGNLTQKDYNLFFNMQSFLPEYIVNKLKEIHIANS